LTKLTRLLRRLDLACAELVDDLTDPGLGALWTVEEEEGILGEIVSDSGRCREEDWPMVGEEKKERRGKTRKESAGVEE